MNNIKCIGILDNDPQINYKLKVFKFLNLKHEILEQKDNPVIDILDLSSFLDVENILEYLERYQKIIVSPFTASKLNDDSSVYTAYPFRQWAIAKKIAEMSRENICGDMTSIRILWSVPKKLSSNKKWFLYSTVAGLIDLANYITKSSLKMMYLEKVKNENNLFGLLTYKNNIALELEINETLPNTMEPARFIKANYTDGCLTNMPIVGLRNDEGSLFANDKELIHTLIEDAQWQNIDEIENTYWQMLLGIDNGNYQEGVFDSKQIINSIRETIKTEQPVSLEV